MYRIFYLMCSLCCWGCNQQTSTVMYFFRRWNFQIIKTQKNVKTTRFINNRFFSSIKISSPGVIICMRWGMFVVRAVHACISDAKLTCLVLSYHILTWPGVRRPMFHLVRICVTRTTALGRCLVWPKLELAFPLWINMFIVSISMM